MIEVDGEALKLKQKCEAEAAGDNDQIEFAIAKCERTSENITNTMVTWERAAAADELTISEGEALLEKLRAEFATVNAKEIILVDTLNCPTCKHPLPEEDIMAAREKAEADFNLGKAKELETINKNGRAIKANVEDAIPRLADIKLELEKQAKEIDVAESEMAKKESLLTETKPQSDYHDDPQYSVLQEEKGKLANEIEVIQSDSKTAVKGIEGEIEQLETAIAEHEQLIAQIQQRESGLVRIEELKAQEKTLAAEYEKLEHELYLIEQFDKSKAELLDSQINAKFKFANFKMFRENINGGIEQCCEVTYKGIPYSNALNNGSKINIGLDIINTLSEHYGFEAPIFIDNAESVVKLIDTTGQKIRLIVSADDKELRVV